MTKSRILEFDVIRFFATLGVIAIHVDTITSSTTNYVGGLSWWFANIIHSLAVVSVPLFVMLSGALILSKQQLSYQYVIKKVMGQFVLPLMIWWPFYYWWTQIRLGNAWSVQNFFVRFFTTEIEHLYFLQIIIALYLVAPFIQRVLRSQIFHKKSTQLGLLATFTVFATMYEVLSFTFFKTYNATNIFVLFVPFILYFLLGKYLHTIKMSVKTWVALASVNCVLVVSIAATTYWNILAFNEGNRLFWTKSGGNFFYEPFSFLVLPLTIGCFILLRNVGVVFKKLYSSKHAISFLTTFAQLSFGIYIIHPFILDRIDHYFNFAIHFITYPLWIYYLQKIIYVTACSAVIVFTVNHLPLLKHTFGIRGEIFNEKA